MEMEANESSRAWKAGDRGGEVELGRPNGGATEGAVTAAAAEAVVPEISLLRLIFSCMVAGGVQYGWALQLSLLTPYVQVTHTIRLDSIFFFS